MRLSLLCCLAALSVLSAPTESVYAQITIDRDTVILNPANASERIADLIVRNTGSANVQASVQLEDWDVDAQGTSHWRKAGAVAGSCGGRVLVSPSALQLAPGEQHVVRVSLKSNARFDAECWSAAVVSATGAATVAANNDSTKSSARTTVPLYVSPSGLRVDGELSDMYVKGDSLEIVFKNTGKVRTNIVGQVAVQTPDESVVTTIPIEAVMVHVGATRRLRVAMPKLPPGKYVLVAMVDFGGDQLTAVQAALEMR
jgi:P pilus assembly chaperone PapD